MTTMKRKPVQLDHHHFGQAPDDPSFNIDAARKAHSDVMRRWDDPVEGDDFKALMLHTIQNMTALEIDKHRADIQRFLDEFGSGQKDTLAKAIVKSYVSTALDAATEFGQSQSEIGKDRQFERLHPRGFHGRFGDAQRGYEPAAQAEDAYGPYHPDRLAHMALLQQAARISGAAGDKGQQVKWQFHDKKGNVRSQILAPHEAPKPKRGEKLVGARGEGIRGNDLTMNDLNFNLVQALGGSAGRARQAADTTTANLAAAHTFHGKWNAHADAHYGTEKGTAYKRIGAGAEALGTIAANSPKAQVAVAVGKWVGTHGTEAEKVIGPHARKTAYKYRGVQRAPRNLPTHKAEMSPEAYHEELVDHIAGYIPDANVHALNLSSGYTAPSHGYLLDSNDKVVAEAHGYGDDHYLPFKLTGLRSIQGGSYIRTRTTGGPTTEDIYTSALSGTKNFTVTSRQGTYEVNYDDEFKHNKRFGDIALGMSKRYGKILDAVDGGKVRVKGEVTDAKYQEWVGEGMNRFANNENQEQLAHQWAREQAEAQEGKSGRELKLNGEGYDYALRALHSQYPYYIASTSYTPPTSERIGHRWEPDTGYVKARHMKSEHAQVGYWDKSIAGEAKDIHGQGTGTGKIQGDLAHYANWARNPYNPKARDVTRRPAPTPTPAPGTGTSTTGAFANTHGSTSLQDGNQLRPTGQGNGRVNLASGLDARGEDLHAKLREMYNHHAEQETLDKMHPDLRHLGHPQNRDEFALAYTKSPGQANHLDSWINSQHQKLLGRGTDTPIHQHPDEVRDATLDSAEHDRRITQLERFLEEPEVRAVRAKLEEVAAHLHSQDSEKFGAADPNSGDWNFYHNIEPKILFNYAWPNGSMAPADRAKMHGAADLIIRREKELEDLEGSGKNPLHPTQRWSPTRAEDMKDAPEPETPSQVTTPEEIKEDPEVKAHTDRADHIANMTEALQQLLHEHRIYRPTDEDPFEYKQKWGDDRNVLGDIAYAWNEASPEDTDSFINANALLGQHLDSLGDWADHGVKLGDGRTVSLREMHIKTHPGVQKRYSISKRNGKYVIRKAA